MQYCHIVTSGRWVTLAELTLTTVAFQLTDNDLSD